jgi:hypothetical protein
VGNVVNPRSEDDELKLSFSALAKHLKELHPAHHRHVPVEQDYIGHAGFAAGQRLLAVASLFDLEFQSFEDVPRNLADHLRIIDDQAALHPGFPAPVR